MIAASFWTILLIITVAIVWLCIVMILATVALESEVWLAGLAAVVVFIIGLAVIIWAGMGDETGDRARCERAGGSWVQTGTQPILVGKVIIQNPVYGCELNR